MSLNKKNNNVEVVLPAGGSQDQGQQPTDPKTYKAHLKSRLITLKGQQKEVQNNIKATQKELNKISKPKTTSNKTTNDVKIVKKGKNKTTGKKLNSKK